MLHWILRPDPQPDLHDHPNAFLSIVLSGSYEEEVPKGPSQEGVGLVRVKWWNFKTSTDKHRIVSLQPPLLTLVFAGSVTRDWGFHAPLGWVPWREYVARRRGERQSS
jgi:hypothetical protein